MQKQFIIRVLMVVMIISAAIFVVAAVNSSKTMAGTEECGQDKQDCLETRSQSEFVLEALTRNLLCR